MGADMLKRLAAEGVRRLALLAIGVVLLAVVFQLFCVAAILGLNMVLPLWAAVLITAVTALILALVLFLLALRTPPAATRSTGGGERTGEETALELGAYVGSATRRRPKTAMAAALALGVVLGADPALRRDLLDLMRTGSGGR